MKSKLVADSAGERTYIVVLDRGEEAFASISEFAAERRIAAASLTALGAFSQATVGWFDLAAKTYRKIPVAEQCEVLSAIGDIALDDKGKPSLHMHVVLGLGDGTTRGGASARGLCSADAGGDGYRRASTSSSYETAGTRSGAD